MEIKPRRTQADRSAATKDALVSAARPLFAEHGYAGVGTESIVKAAGVTRGAMYHQFADKTELFAAVFEAVEMEITHRIDRAVQASGTADPLDLMVIGAEAWLRACLEPEVNRIVLIDAPAVLGWERWREIGAKYGMGLIESLLQSLMADGRIPQQPLKATAHVLLGALDEAALYVARSEDPEQAIVDSSAVFKRLIGALAAP